MLLILITLAKCNITHNIWLPVNIRYFPVVEWGGDFHSRDNRQYLSYHDSNILLVFFSKHKLKLKKNLLATLC